MKKVVDFILYLIIVLGVAIIVANAVSDNAFDDNIETLRTEVQSMYDEKAETCSHSWKVLDKDNSEWDAVLVACEDCGDILIAEYRNHRFIERK